MHRPFKAHPRGWVWVLLVPLLYVLVRDGRVN